MSHFYVSCQGGRGEATRTGTMSSGVVAHPRGWNVGVLVDGRVTGTQDEQPHDVFRVYATGGSHSSGTRHLVAEVHEGREVVLYGRDGKVTDRYVLGSF